MEAKTSSELFKKHFGESAVAVSMFHPNIMDFFQELNDEILKEDACKVLNQKDASNPNGCDSTDNGIISNQ